jgi:hypothetical protein
MTPSGKQYTTQSDQPNSGLRSATIHQQQSYWERVTKVIKEISVIYATLQRQHALFQQEFKPLPELFNINKTLKITHTV